MSSKLIGLTAAVILLSSSVAEAADLYWSVPAGDWSTPDNWGGTEPTSSDNAYIQNGGTSNIIQSGATYQALYLGVANTGTIQMDAGSLSGNTGYIGYSNMGTVFHSAGTNTFSNGSLCLGYNSGGSGTYNLNGTGILNVGTVEYIGYSGVGIFTHSAGTHTIRHPYYSDYYLYLGYNSLSNGTYNLQGTGQLSADWEYVGRFGAGTINHSAGINTVMQLHLGTYEGSNGNYNLSGTGQLNAQYEYIGHFHGSGTATFIQSGGTNTISGNLYFGDLGGADTTYDLSNTGQLTTQDQYIRGIFTQSGGNNNANCIYLEDVYSKRGIYNLTGSGQLSAQFEYIGNDYRGTFNQSGGTNTVLKALYFGNSSGFGGTYNLTGGTLIVPQLEKKSPTQFTDFNFGGGTIQASDNLTTTLAMTLTGNGGNANIDTAGYAVTLSGVLSGTAGLNKLGSGTLTFNAFDTYSGDTIIKGGTLEIAGGIGASGTSLIDVQSGKAIFKSVNVSKANLNVNTAALATFEILNGAHDVGIISGSGITQIDSGASLSVAAINQDTVNISSGATITIRPISGGPLSGQIASVPEPSTIVMLLGAFILPFMILFKKRLA